MSTEWAEQALEEYRNMSIADPNQAELSYAEPGETNPNGSSRRAALLPVDEFLINRISTAIESPKEWTKADTDEIITRLSAAEAEIEGALGLGWHDFLSLIFSVAMSTADDSAHRALCHVVFGLAKTIADDNEAETLKFVRNSPNFEEFSWIAKDLWDGPRIYAYGIENPEGRAAQTAWVNYNRFMAHLCVQQRITPVEPLQDWLEYIGLRTIEEGLEDRKMAAPCAEPAAAWLTIAGRVMHADLTRCRRDGSDETAPEERPRQIGDGGPLWDNQLAAGAWPEERWDFWKKRLGEIAGQESLSPQVREAARRAQEEMVSIESSSW